MLLSRWFTSACLLAASIAPAAAGEIDDLEKADYAARDTLAKIDEPDASARVCLEALAWPPDAFKVRCEDASVRSGRVIVRFPSPLVTGNAVNDSVAMEWYVARDEAGAPIKAPAVVVVHESGSRMTIGRVVAQGLRLLGLHAFLIQLPHYGLRRGGEEKHDADDFVARMKQGVADVRRARDAVAALPFVDQENICLQGTSLGGFVAADSGALDGAYDGVFIMLAGGDLCHLIENGQRDAAKVREKLKAAGLDDEQLRKVLWQVEPTRIAHRLDARRTWLFSGQYDTVVPPHCSDALARSAGLDPAHHIQLAADHYSGVVFLPLVLGHMQRQITGK